jgi:organic radical activating enzyme
MNTSLHSGRKFCSWLITNFCNFHCSYCFGGGSQQIKEKWDIKLIIKTLKQTGEKWCIGITGGEPFAYPEFVDICKQMVDNDIKLWIDTNLSIDSSFKEFVARISPDMVENLYIASHIEEREKRSGINSFFDKLNILRENRFPFEINYVLHPRMIKRFYNDAEQFQKRGFSLLPKPFQGIYKFRTYPESYSPREKQLILKHDPEAFRRSLFRSRGLLCNAGSSMVRLTSGGVFTRCVADSTVIGNLQDGISLLKNPAKCKSIYCPCFGWDLIEDMDKKAMLSKNLSDKKLDLLTIKRYLGFYFRLAKKKLKR